MKVQKQVGKVLSQERGKNVIAVCCMEAAGQYVPAMLIFPRAKPGLISKAPPDTVATLPTKRLDDLRHFSSVVKTFCCFRKAYRNCTSTPAIGQP